jgi:hypothetical protein
MTKCSYLLHTGQGHRQPLYFFLFEINIPYLKVARCGGACLYHQNLGD